MSPFGLKFSQMILQYTETSKLMYNWSFLFEVLHKLTLLPSTFKQTILSTIQFEVKVRYQRVQAPCQEFKLALI